MLRNARRLCVGLAATLALTGCGGGGGGSSTAPPSPSPAPAPPAQPAPPAPAANRFPVAQFTGQPAFRVAVLHPVDFDASFQGTAFVDPDGDPLTYRAEFQLTPPAGLTISGARIT